MSEERLMDATTEVRREALLPFSDPNSAPPTPAEFREVTRLLALTGSQAGALLGVDGRTIRKWIGGEREVPYSAWRLLLLEAGMALPATSRYDDDRQLTWAGFKAAVSASGVRDGDVIERMDFFSKKFKVRTVEQNPGEPRYIQIVTPAEGQNS